MVLCCRYVYGHLFLVIVIYKPYCSCVTWLINRWCQNISYRDMQIRANKYVDILYVSLSNMMYIIDLKNWPIKTDRRLSYRRGRIILLQGLLTGWPRRIGRGGQTVANICARERHERQARGVRRGTGARWPCPHVCRTTLILRRPRQRARPRPRTNDTSTTPMPPVANCNVITYSQCFISDRTCARWNILWKLRQTQTSFPKLRCKSSWTWFKLNQIT